MSVDVAPEVMSGEEFLALPDNDVRRELIRGRLREEPKKLRNYRHSMIEANVAAELKNWVMLQVSPRGRVVCGEAGFRLRRDPDTFVGVAVAYMSPEQVAVTSSAVAYPDGAPVLVVEILSPSDTYEDISNKIREYLDTGVRHVWVVDPKFSTIQVHRPGGEPESFNVKHELSAEPQLPGFRVPVSRIFEE